MLKSVKTCENAKKKNVIKLHKGYENGTSCMFGSGVSVWYLPDWLYLWKGSTWIDIRKYGSGNSGSTNALRVMGKKAGLTVFLGDFLKTVIPCMAVRFVFKDQPDYAYVYMLYIGLGVILGHNYPFYLHFKGGKGIAATAGIIFSIDWRLTVLCLAVFVLIVAVTRYVSLGSLVVSVILLAWNIYMGKMRSLQFKRLFLL